MINAKAWNHRLWTIPTQNSGAQEKKILRYVTCYVATNSEVSQATGREPHREIGVNCHVSLAPPPISVAGFMHPTAFPIPRISAPRGNTLSPLSYEAF